MFTSTEQMEQAAAGIRAKIPSGVRYDTLQLSNRKLLSISSRERLNRDHSPMAYPRERDIEPLPIQGAELEFLNAEEKANLLVDQFDSKICS